VQNKKSLIFYFAHTKDISSRKGNLGKIYKRIASNIRFYEFLQKLKFKCNENHVNLKITDESYTSKMCSLCVVNYKLINTFLR